MIGILYFKMLLFLRQRKSMKLKLPNWGSLCNSNLLLNSDFRYGVINQKGQTSYTNNGSYTIDMWQSTTGSGGDFEVKVNSNSITLINNSSTQDLYFIQKLTLSQEQRTFAIKVKSSSGVVKAYVVNSAGRQGVVSITGEGLFKNTVNVDITNFTILIEKQGSVEIEFVKLEKGSYFTGMLVWYEALEILKCQRHMYACGVMGGYGFQAADGYFYIYINIPAPMKKKGTVKLNSTIYVIGDNSYVSKQISEASISNQDNNTVILKCKIDTGLPNNIVKVVELRDLIIDGNEY